MTADPDHASLPGHRHAREREAAYTDLFGSPVAVHHEVAALVPHIDVYEVGPTHARPFVTLVTGGLSDLPMRVPEGVEAPARAELVIYLAEPSAFWVETLRSLARLPHDAGTWLGEGHTVPNGDPPAPILPGSDLTAFLLIETIAVPDADLPGRLRIEGDPVALLWVVPITTPELELKLEQGTDALLARFDGAGLPLLLDVTRSSVVYP